MIGSNPVGKNRRGGGAQNMFNFIDDFIKKIEDWISGNNSNDDDDPDSNLLPVLLVPGIGASILHAVENENSSKYERVWVRLFFADRDFKKKVWSLFDPQTGKTTCLSKTTHIEVPDDNHGLYSCDFLDPAMIIRFDILNNFHDMIEQMKAWGYKEGTTLFGYGYDFRQSNRLPEAVGGLQARLEKIQEVSGGKKVNIVSHSMGGLLVKSFLALQPDVFEKLVNSWITISTPFQGAPGFVTDCLLTGVEFLKGWQKELWVAKWSTHQLLVECPSVYEMMASLTHEWERPPQLCVWRNKDTGAEFKSYGPLESVPILKAALEDNKLCYDGEWIPIPFNDSILQWSNESRCLWLNAKLPEGVKFYNLYGTSCETPFDICYGSEEKPIIELKELLHTEAEFVCVDGDGTVPAESSKADGLKAAGRYGIPGDHRGLLRSSEVFQLLKELLEVKKQEPSVNVGLSATRTRASRAFSDEEYVCLPVATRFSNNWDAISDDSEDYNLAEEAVFSINVGDAKAEARSSASIHQAHEGFEEEHVLLHTIGVCEGVNAEQAKTLLKQAMAGASTKFQEIYL